MIIYNLIIIHDYLMIIFEYEVD